MKDLLTPQGGQTTCKLTETGSPIPSKPLGQAHTGEENFIQVVSCYQTLSAIGLASRRQRSGPETNLVNWFLDELPILLPARCCATIFREPRIDSGFPDLVVAIWHRSKVANWRSKWASARTRVSTTDLRVMHYAFERGGVDQQELEMAFQRPLARSLKRLTEASMLEQEGERWRSNTKHPSFALRNLVSIEAKISNWAGVLRQAAVNNWFASTSCVLLPKAPRSEEIIRDAAALGVEILAQDKAPFDWRNLPPAPAPRSYASWQVNEWVWRHAALRWEPF